MNDLFCLRLNDDRCEHRKERALWTRSFFAVQLIQDQIVDGPAPHVMNRICEDIMDFSQQLKEICERIMDISLERFLAHREAEPQGDPCVDVGLSNGARFRVHRGTEREGDP